MSNRGDRYPKIYPGAIGPVGPEGPIGPEGPEGPQGPAGVDGIDGAGLLPVSNDAIYAGGPKTFTLTDVAYDGFVSVFVNGLRIDTADWGLSGTTLTILGDLKIGDEVTCAFFISDPLRSGSPPWYENYTKHGPIIFQMIPDPQYLGTPYYTDNYGQQIEYFGGKAQIAKGSIVGNNNTCYSFDRLNNAIYSNMRSSLGVSGANLVNPFLVHAQMAKAANEAKMSVHLAFRLYRSSFSAYEFFCQFGTSITCTGLYFVVSSSRIYFYRQHPDADQRNVASFAATIGVGDHHITCVNDQADIHIYHNGVLLGTLTDASFDIDVVGDVYEILTGMNLYSYADLAISGFMIYNKSLSPADVTELHATTMFGGENPLTKTKSDITKVDFEAIFAEEFLIHHAAPFPVNYRAFLSTDGYMGAFTSGAANSTFILESTGLRCRGVANEGNIFIQYTLAKSTDLDFVAEYSMFCEFTIPTLLTIPSGATYTYSTATLFEQGVNGALDHTLLLYDGTNLELYHAGVLLLTYGINLVDDTRHIVGVVVADTRYEIWVDGTLRASDYTEPYLQSGNQSQNLIFNTIDPLAPGRFCGYLHAFYYNENRAFTALECASLVP